MNTVKVSTLALFVFSIAGLFQQIQAAATTKPTTKATTTTPPPKVNGFTDQQKQVILDTHNRLRIQENAENMETLVWDDVLAKLAQDWSNGCVYAHRPDKSRNNVGGFWWVGENIYVTTAATLDPARSVTAWYEEKKYYNYDTITCMAGKVCGHYTQVVWDSTTNVGCGKTYCPDLMVDNTKGGWMVVCDYGEGGNIPGVNPYYLAEK